MVFSPQTSTSVSLDCTNARPTRSALTSPAGINVAAIKASNHRKEIWQSQAFTSPSVEVSTWCPCKCCVCLINTPILFADVDECANRLLNTCPIASKCINFDGGYRCECNRTNQLVESSTVRTVHTTGVCSTCLVHGVEREHGQRWSPASDPCTTCHCVEGVVHCEARQCDCTKASGGDPLCCPQCRHDKVCLHQENRAMVYRSGQRWNYDCQTCECMVSASESMVTFRGLNKAF